MKKILLHMCCGPCSCYPVKRLRELGYEPVGYFFNPNIHPYREFIQRIETAKEFASKSDMEIIVDDNYQLRDFLTRALSAEAEDANGRCQMCYTWRLEQAAAFAKENGYEVFTASLFVSPYQQHELMRETAAAAAKKEGIEFFYEDFRPGWQNGADISLEMELYRQPYCGCIFSEEERYSKKLRQQRRQEAKAKKQLAAVKEQSAK